MKLVLASAAACVAAWGGRGGARSQSELNLDMHMAIM